MNWACKKIQKRLSAFLDGELKPRKSSAVERHVFLCPDCRRELEETASAWKILDRFEAIEVQEIFEAGFWQKARESGSPQLLRPRFIRSLVPMPALAILCLILGIAAGIFLGKVFFTDNGTAISSKVLQKDENFPYLDNFADFPGDSVGGAYIAVASQTVDSGRGSKK